MTHKLEVSGKLSSKKHEVSAPVWMLTVNYTGRSLKVNVKGLRPGVQWKIHRHPASSQRKGCITQEARDGCLEEVACQVNFKG